ncbi:PREDICTED: valine--tRNA ligase, mitochondrial 1-like, partial [Camelina sativa]
MLGDTAIAVHPDDARYKHLHGKFAVHPFNGRKLPIICDGILVDPNFGTGCVKITPAHDPNDCEVGKRHKLEFINIFTDDGKINTNGGSDFTGMPRFAAREAVVEALQKH